MLVKPHPNGWLAAVQETLKILPPVRNPSPTRVVASGITARIVTALARFRLSKCAATLKAANAPQRSTARHVWLPRTVPWSLTCAGISHQRCRAAAGRSKVECFGGIQVLTTEGANGPIAVRTKYVLEWLGSNPVPPSEIWVGEVEDHGVLASFAVNSRL